MKLSTQGLFWFLCYFLILPPLVDGAPRLDSIKSKISLTIKPDDVDTQIELAYAHHYAGNANEALRVLKKALGANPKNARVYYGLGWVNGKAGRYTDALPAYRRAAELKPDDPYNRFALGWVYGELEMFQESVKEFKEALRLKADYRETREALDWASAQLSGQGSRKPIGGDSLGRDSNDAVVTRPYQPTEIAQPTMAGVK